jgi:hypothetical protein
MRKKRVKKKKISEEEKEIQNWIKEGLKKGYEIEYLEKIVEIYKLELKAYYVLRE